MTTWIQELDESIRQYQERIDTNLPELQKIENMTIKPIIIYYVIAKI